MLYQVQWKKKWEQWFGVALHPPIPQEKFGFKDDFFICKNSAKDTLANLSKCSIVLLQSIKSCLDFE